jgi:hypothetical protein
MTGAFGKCLEGASKRSPRPQLGHGHTQARLLGELSGPFDRGRGGPGGWWLVVEPDVELEPHERRISTLRVGIPHYWIVDPEERTLEAFDAKAGAWAWLGARSDGDTPRIPPFEAIELDVGGLFTPLP